MNPSGSELSLLARFAFALLVAISIAGCPAAPGTDGSGGTSSGGSGSTGGGGTGGGTGGTGGGGTGGGTGGGGTPATGTYLISWDAVAGATGYKIYYTTASFSNGATIQSITVGNVLSYVFDPAAAGILSGSTLHVAVSATGGGLESPVSTEASIVVN